MHHRKSSAVFRPRSPTIAALLYGVNALIVAAGFVIMTLWADRAMKSAAENQLHSDLAAAAAVVGELLEGGGYVAVTVDSDSDGKNLSPSFATIGANSFVTVTNWAGRIAMAGGGGALRITLVARDGAVVWDTATDEPLENHLDRPEIKAAFAAVPATQESAQVTVIANDSEATSDIRRSTVTGDDVMYYAVPITLSGAVYALRLACPIRRTVYYAHAWRVRRVAVAAAVAAAVLLLTYMASAFIVHGINALRQEARQLKGADYHIPLRAPREVLLLQAAMERMASELHRLERVRQDFIANVSHELRTPVTSIVGFSETLLDTEETIPMDGEAREFLQIINTQGKRLMAIIEDLLTLSRLERDSMKPEMTRCRVSELTQMVCHNFVARADERGTKLIFVSDDEDAECMVNEQLYEEALGNIIDNAIKYCPPKSRIEVKVTSGAEGNGATGTAQRAKEGGQANMVRRRSPTVVRYDLKVYSPTTCRITVTDNGPGIPEKYRERVFERFFRVDKGRSRDMGGTGLGLSISAHIVQSHGGTLRAQGRADGKRGAVFVMELPRISG